MSAQPKPITLPGDVLSPSSCTQYRRCPAQWRYRHIDHLPDPKTGALLVGSCLHAAIAENMRQKIETKQDLPAAGVQAIYTEAWGTLIKETEFHPDEDPGELQAVGRALALKYLDEACPSIEPAAVELPITGDIGGVPVRGYVDLLDTSGRVIELKSAARKPSEVSPDHRFQVATYRALSPQVSGEARVDTLVKTKTPQLVEMPYTVQVCDLAEIERMYPLVQRAIRTGLFLPNRSNYMCSRKYCAFWRACQNEFGGEVGE
jgi:putative RecB family exonuclease